VLSDELRDNCIIVATELEADLPTIDADHVQIQQTLINLVHNAMEATNGVTDRARSLVLSSRRQGAELLIQVRDNGVGSKDPTLIFEPSLPRKSQAWGWACPFVARSSRRMAAESGRPRTKTPG